MSSMTDTLTIIVIEPEELAPVGRLGEWLFAEGAALRMVRPWRGDPIPSLSEVGDGLVVLGGSMSAHDEADHPWLADLRELLRGVVADDVPAIAICLGAQVAAEALGGSTAVPALGNDEVGVVELTITAAGESDPVFGAVAAEAIRAAHRAGIPTSDGTRLPVIVSHHDAVTHLPEAATRGAPGGVALRRGSRAAHGASLAGRVHSLPGGGRRRPRRAGRFHERPRRG